MPSLAEVGFLDVEVGTVDYLVAVEVSRLHTALPKLALERIKVGSADYVVGVGVSTLD